MSLLIKIEKEQLKDVAKLEKQSYPEYLCLGYEDFLHDYKLGAKKKDYNYSYGIYNESKELKGYIIAYKENNTIYISDLVCKNPMYLYSLLIKFKTVVDKSVVTCECRKTSYKLLKKLKKQGIITISEENYYKGYYYLEEDMWELKFNLI